MRGNVVAIGFLVFLGFVAFVLANATANKLSKPIEQSDMWRSLFGR